MARTNSSKPKLADTPDRLDTYEVEVAEPASGRLYPLVNTYTKIREPDRDTVQRVPEFPNDDDPEAARQNAAAVGRRAGEMGVESSIIDDAHGAAAGLFQERGNNKALRLQAAGDQELGALAATSGAVEATATDFDLRDGLLAEEEQEGKEQARQKRAAGEAAQEKRAAKPPLERGSITEGAEVGVMLLLGAADIVTLGVFMVGRVETAPFVAWITAFLAGLGAAATGWAGGRGLLGRTANHEERRRALLTLLLLTLPLGVWFVAEMYGMRGEEAERGVAAAVTFGAPLCGLTIVAAAIVSFVGAAGRPGLELKEYCEALLRDAGEDEDKAQRTRKIRHELRSNQADAKGEARAAQDRMPHVRSAKNNAAAAERKEGIARWKCAGTFLQLYSPQHSEGDTVALQGLAALTAEDDPLRVELSRRARLIALLSGALGGGGLTLVALTGGAPVGIVALGAAGGSALGTCLARRVAREPTSSIRGRLVKARTEHTNHNNGQVS